MAEPQWMHHLEEQVGAWAVRSHRRPAVALVVALVATAVGGYYTQKLPLIADLEHLLPNSFQSVRDLEPLRQRFGGIGYVCVVGMDAEPDQLRRFADEYAPKLEKLEGIRYVDYKRPYSFFEERSLYYLSLEDLKEVHGRLSAREKWERRQQNPLFIKLDDEPAPSLDFSDLEAKYGRRTDQRIAGSGEEYYLDPAKRMVVLMAKPARTSGDLAFANELIGRVEEYFTKEDLKRFGPSFHVGLTGTFKYKVDQQRQISNDIAKSSALAFALLILFLAVHFRSLLAVLLVNAPVLAGLAWTYGIIWLVYGSMNVLTGFLGAILGGLGFEHGIHILGRYSALRREGHSSEDATREAFTHTGGAAIVSAVVAALSFAAIAWSDFKAFREFGVTAATGMLVIIVGYVLILPPLLGLATRLKWSPRRTPTGGTSELARWLPRYRWGFTIAVAAMVVYFFVHLPGVQFNYDFHSLEDSSLPSFVLDREVNRILGYSQEPVVILTERAASEAGIAKELRRRKETLGAASTVDFVSSLSELVPERQPEKREVLVRIGGILSKVKPDKLEPSSRERYEKLARWAKSLPFTRAEIPESVRRQFEGVSQTPGGFVLIFPGIKLSDGKRVREFAKEVRGVQLPGGERVSAAGEAMILADVLEMLIHDFPRILLASLLLVFVAMWATLGSLRESLMCMSPTVLSILGLVGFIAMAGLEFNYLNVMVIPVLVGTTVDAGVHLISRFREARGRFSDVFGETGRAVVGGLLTSVVGFGAMLLADHPGLNSLGTLANLGFAINLLTMLLGFPAWLLVLERVVFGKRDDKAADKPQEAP